jgi:hypothetical protein
MSKVDTKYNHWGKYLDCYEAETGSIPAPPPLTDPNSQFQSPVAHSRGGGLLRTAAELFRSVKFFRSFLWSLPPEIASISWISALRYLSGVMSLYSDRSLFFSAVAFERCFPSNSVRDRTFFGFFNAFIRTFREVLLLSSLDSFNHDFLVKYSPPTNSTTQLEVIDLSFDLTSGDGSTYSLTTELIQSNAVFEHLPLVFIVHFTRIIFDTGYRAYRCSPRKVEFPFECELRQQDGKVASYVIRGLVSAEGWAELLHCSFLSVTDKHRNVVNSEYHKAHVCAIVFVQKGSEDQISETMPEVIRQFAQKWDNGHIPAPIRELQLFDESSILANATLGIVGCKHEPFAKRVLFQFNDNGVEGIEEGIKGIAGDEFSLWELDWNGFIFQRFDPKTWNLTNALKKFDCLTLFVEKNKFPSDASALLFAFFFHTEMRFPLQYLGAIPIKPNTTFQTMFTTISEIIHAVPETQYQVFRPMKSAPVSVESSSIVKSGMIVFQFALKFGNLSYESRLPHPFEFGIPDFGVVRNISIHFHFPYNDLFTLLTSKLIFLWNYFQPGPLCAVRIPTSLAIEDHNQRFLNLNTIRRKTVRCIPRTLLLILVLANWPKRISASEILDFNTISVRLRSQSL